MRSMVCTGMLASRGALWSPSLSRTPSTMTTWLLSVVTPKPRRSSVALLPSDRSSRPGTPSSLMRASLTLATPESRISRSVTTLTPKGRVVTSEAKPAPVTTKVCEPTRAEVSAPPVVPERCAEAVAGAVVDCAQAGVPTQVARVTTAMALETEFVAQACNTAPARACRQARVRLTNKDMEQDPTVNVPAGLPASAHLRRAVCTVRHLVGRYPGWRRRPVCPSQRPVATSGCSTRAGSPKTPVRLPLRGQLRLGRRCDAAHPAPPDSR